MKLQQQQLAATPQNSGAVFGWQRSVNRVVPSESIVVSKTDFNILCLF